MPRRMVSAFKKGIEEEKEALKGLEKERGRATLTMNPRRQEILQYLCRYPCSRLSKIAKDLELSTAATKWHLTRLAEKGFIAQEVKGETIYYPAKMIYQNDIETFKALNNERATPILRRILSNPGIKQKNLRDDVQLNQRTVVRHAYELEQVGLIESIQDGKFRRYYPTRSIEKMEEIYRKRAGKFRKYILKMLKNDGVSPEVVRATDKALHVKIIAGEKKSVLELNTRPFASIHEPYKGL